MSIVVKVISSDGLMAAWASIVAPRIFIMYVCYRRVTQVMVCTWMHVIKANRWLLDHYELSCEETGPFQNSIRTRERFHPGASKQQHLISILNCRVYLGPRSVPIFWSAVVYSHWQAGNRIGLHEKWDVEMGSFHWELFSHKLVKAHIVCVNDYYRVSHQYHSRRLVEAPHIILLRTIEKAGQHLSNAALVQHVVRNHAFKEG